MNSLMKTVAATAMLMGSGFATTASADVATTTCGDFMSMEDDAARLVTAHELLLWINDTANFASVGPLESYKMVAPDLGDSGTKKDDDASDTLLDKGWTDAEMVISIQAHCFHQPSDMNVIERLKAPI